MEFVETPPEHKRRALSQKWLGIVAELKKAHKKDPTKWGNVGTYSPGTATGIRRGKYAAFLEGMPEGDDPETWMYLHWEVTTRKVEGGSKNDIYIRYLG
jgi:hypothetical protein